MKIDRVTFTGVDDSTNIKELELISEEFPFVEFGILYSENQEGKGGKYPSKENILKFLIANPFEERKYKTSLHLCGSVARDFLKKDYEFDMWNVNPTSLSDLIRRSDRIQLNFSAKRNKPNLFRFLSNVEKFRQPFILQIHKGNEKFIESIIPYTGDEFHYLFDASGGNGVVIEEITQPLQNKYCSYAGGLSPINIKEKLELLNKSLPIKSVIGIDMETGVRTDGIFDIKKVRQCLLEIKKYI